MTTKIKFIFCLIALGAVVWLWPAEPASAAEILFESNAGKITVGDAVAVQVYLRTDGEPVNAVEGMLAFSADTLAFKKITDGNSIINFWVKSPQAAGNQISFAGITPGGYNGSNGFLFTALFEAKKAGATAITLPEISVLKNDGKGTALPVTAPSLKLTVALPEQKQPEPEKMVEPVIESTEPLTAPVAETADTEPPELFSPQIARDENIFGGQYFLVFNAQDKGAGVDRYEVMEKKQADCFLGFLAGGRWRPAASPYLLNDQNLESFIFVKAVDKAGNERLATLWPKNPPAWYEKYLIWVIMLLVISGLAAIGFRRQGAPAKKR